MGLSILLVLDGEGRTMQGYGGKPTAPLARQGAGTWAALTLFGLASWWGLWGAAVEHAAVPNGFGWFNSGRAVEVGAALILPGAACRLAFRIIRAHRREETHRLGLSALWMLWALSGLIGQATLGYPRALFTASLLNAAAIATLMCLESRPNAHVLTRFAAC